MSTQQAQPRPVNSFVARIVAIRQETPTIKSFTLDCDQSGFAFLPGQWIDLQVDVDGKHEVGGYSMTNAPGKGGRIELAVKYSESHPVTHYLHARARVGDRVVVSNGSGTFVYNRTMGEHVVLIGAGVGVTPLLSILRHIYDEQPGVSATLLYSVAVPEEILFADELRRMSEDCERVRLLITVTQPQGTGWDGLVGRIDDDKLRLAGLNSHTLYYICGPNAMVDATAQRLTELGVPADNVIFEKWW